MHIFNGPNGVTLNWSRAAWGGRGDAGEPQLAAGQGWGKEVWEQGWSWEVSFGWGAQEPIARAGSVLVRRWGARVWPGSREKEVTAVERWVGGQCWT